MKKIILILLGLAMGGLTAHPDANHLRAKNTSDDMKTNVLVAYFSATGTTKARAEAIAQAVGATIYEITPVSPYTAADLDWRDRHSRSTREMTDASSRPAILSDSLDMAAYDVVFVGYPIWWDVCPRPVNTWIESHDLQGKTLIPFATSGSSPIDGSLAAFRRLYPSLTWAPGRLLNGPVSEAATWAKEVVGK